MANEIPPLMMQPLPDDDVVIVFRTERSAIRGRLVRMGPTVDTIVSRHRMPDTVSEVLGQAVTLAALFGSVLPSAGKIIFQTRTDGAVSFLVADYDAPGRDSVMPAPSGETNNHARGRLRGYARYDADKLAALVADGDRSPSDLILGDGHLAITVDQGDATERYQGVIALEGTSLEAAASAYFEQREGVSTFVRLAVAQTYNKPRDGSLEPWHWRAGGLMMQTVQASIDDRAEGEPEPDIMGAPDDDAWTRVHTLAATVEHHELLDPGLSPERLLLRLFHEEGVRIERVLPLSTYCRCSRDRVFDVLRSFGAKELADMHDETGKVVVRCEFCTTAYAFELSEIDESSA